MRLSLLAFVALSLAAPAFAAPPVATTLALERELPKSTEVGIPDVVTFVADGEVIPAAPPASSVLSGFFSQFLTPQGIASIVLTVLGLVAGALGLTALRKRQIAIVTQHAFHGVEDFSATTENTIDDKVAAGLRIADEWMRAQGWRPLKPGEAEVVKLGFTALNGATKLAEKVAAGAQVEATKALTSPEVRAELNDLARGVPSSP